MPLVVGSETYERWILEPDEELDGEFEAAQQEFFIAQASEDTKKIEKAQEKYDEARRLRLEEGKKVVITYRPLTARDQAEMEDTVRVGDEDGRSVRPGEMKMLSVKRAVQKWTGSPPWSDAVCERLFAGVYTDIYGWVSFSVEPPKQDEFGDPILRQPMSRAERRAEENKKQDRPKRKTATASAPPADES